MEPGLRTFEESLKRVLDPDGLYWHYPGDDADDPERIRLVEVRLDVPIAGVVDAQEEMQRAGWVLSSRPDDACDPIQRLFFRREQSVCPQHKVAMLTTSLRAAFRGDGRFWSWINVEDLDEDCSSSA